MPDFSHLVVGAGVVGLAVGARLARRAGTAVLVAERHAAVGTETSSRNSEVIHAGLYYPPGSLKADLCIRGKHLLYDTCGRNGLAHRRCGKWILAQDEAEHAYLEEMHSRARQLGVPTAFVPLDAAAAAEPAVRARAAVLESPTTGIVSAHELMAFLHGDLEAHGGDLALQTAIESIERVGSEYEVVFGGPAGAGATARVGSVINCAGLSAPAVANLLLPPDRHVQAFYAKGSYFSYSASQPKTSRLVYPCPAGHAGLGTHLTLDLAGRLRFGPNVEWTSSADDVAASGSQLDDVFAEVSRYLPGVDRAALAPDYAGVRPKLAGPGSGFQDFVIRAEPDLPGVVNLLGIESPGLTSSLAIAEHVERLVT
ncbi:putative FAD-dependent oxidoreductase [Dipodascopsis tothii]|uniref:putative FAD-dependent oxidoreductase n=1 Tax=Dipodascopsis tothii TaxID=44089 RepID=UPI0034CF7D78